MTFTHQQVAIQTDVAVPLSLGPGSDNGGVVSRDDCGRAFPDELRVSSLTWRLPTLRMGSVTVSRTDSVHFVSVKGMDLTIYTVVLGQRV